MLFPVCGWRSRLRPHPRSEPHDLVHHSLRHFAGSPEPDSNGYPVSFYRNKARLVKATAEKLATSFGGWVPRTMEELTALPGVGRKTANLVLFPPPRVANICVDTNVHRISNRLGWVIRRSPRTPSRGCIPSFEQRWWPYIYLYLVTWGQNACRPVFPRCGACAIRDPARELASNGSKEKYMRTSEEQRCRC